MPININDIKPVATKKKVNKDRDIKATISKKLTGTGGKAGILCDNANPINQQGETAIPGSEFMFDVTSKISQGKYDIDNIKIEPLSIRAVQELTMRNFPAHNDTMTEVKFTDDTEVRRVFIDMVPQSIILTSEKSSTTGPLKKDMRTMYLASIYFMKDIDDTTAMNQLVSTSSISEERYYKDCKASTESIVLSTFTCNPSEFLDGFKKVVPDLNKKYGYSLDTSDLDTYLDEYSLYEAVADQAEKINTKLAETLEEIIEDTSYAMVPGRSFEDSKREPKLIALLKTLSAIETMNVPLQTTKKIYDIIQNFYEPQICYGICAFNTNLLMCEKLQNLQNLSPQLPTVVATPGQALPPAKIPYSKEQLEAITTDKPLSIVQAGAGTGKSTVILGRIEYMQATGVDPKDILVLSFTNAAADNIRARNPLVNSMTISKMICDIYAQNFPQHQLSEIMTVINSLSIFYKDDDIAEAFGKKLHNVSKNEVGAMTSLANFVDANFDIVISMLNGIRQTTLELEIIICYLKSDLIVEPKHVLCKHLIVDEVQDNSIFDFVYTLNFITKLKASLFIVGDCSQTLFEFRSANPRALNLIESSGVFETYQLQTNYRSNQEILDFANIGLSSIEANQFANIQLSSNTLSDTTSGTFKEKVKLINYRTNKSTDVRMGIHNVLAGTAKNYINEKIAQGEQIAIIAHSRTDVKKAQETIEEYYPTLKVASLLSDIAYGNNTFSNFIKHKWDQVSYVPQVNIIPMIKGLVITYVDTLRNADKMLAPTHGALNKWEAKYSAVITDWVLKCQQALITEEELLDNIKNTLLDYEIANNAIKKSLTAERNKNNKNDTDIDDANILISTIHGSKGLEFDNVIVLYKDSNDMSEEKKRMYYVALTRAMKSEMIISFSSNEHPNISIDYDRIVDYLTKLENVTDEDEEVADIIEE